MDMPTPSQKRPASLPLNVEAHQPIARVGSISLPRVLRLAPTPPQKKKNVPQTLFTGLNQAHMCQQSVKAGYAGQVVL